MTGACVSVIGLGKIGAPLAACLAARGFRVVGVDTDRDKVNAVNRGRAPVREPRLADLIARCRGALTATTDVAEAVAASSTTFVLVGSAGDREKPISIRGVRAACADLGTALRGKRGEHLVVIASTVPPGATVGELLPALERSSGKIAWRDFGLCYSPEFVALGTAVDDFLRPRFALVGEHDARSGDALARLYASFFEVETPLLRMSIVSAEIAKLAFNNFLAMKVSFANLLAGICERVPGADAAAVTRLLQQDPRIGDGFLRGALSFGGPCLPRDVAELARLTDGLGLDASLPLAVDRINRERHADVLRLVRRAAADAARRIGRPARIGVLGIAFKPGTGVTELSASLALIEGLANGGPPIAIHDPAATLAASPGIEAAATADACVRAADVVVIATPWPEYARLDPKLWSGKILIDCWRIVGEAGAQHAERYIPCGVGPRAQTDIAPRSSRRSRRKNSDS